MVHICPVGARDGTRPCIHCKGHHKEENCPLYKRALQFYKVQKKVKQSFAGSAPAPFIGRYGYPHVNVGILAPPVVSSDVWEYDAPRHWAHSDFQIPEIISFRSSMINSRTQSNVRSFSCIQEMVQEVAMAKKPVDMEFKLKKSPHVRLKLDGTVAPSGPSAQLQKAEITSNPQVPTRVDRAVADIDWKAAEAVVSLYDHGFDENYLTKLLSVGSLGIGANRRMVPTRWSITATDDILGKDLLNRIRNFSPINDFLAFTGSYLGNYYIILCFPDVWSYELFENYVPGWKSGQVRWSTDFEPFRGRMSYAEQCAGGYYTVKLAILEQLKRMKRQARVLVIRFVTEEYTVPLGVWTTREAARKAMRSKPINFATKELLLQYAKSYVRRKFGLDCSVIYQNSKLLKTFQQQKLFQYNEAM